MFLSFHEAQERNKYLWLLDSGCSNHIIGDKCIFVNVDNSVRYDVILGDDKVVNVVGKGTVIFLTK